jgi:DNA-binding response OmpR family regulator
MRILLVEDSKLLRATIERALTRQGYVVLGAGDGEEALRLATTSHPDLILLDMMLPKITGSSVLQSLKINPTTLHIPVIVLSSLSRKNETRFLIEGAAAYFEKSEKGFEKDMVALVELVKSIIAKNVTNESRQGLAEEK